MAPRTTEALLLGALVAAAGCDDAPTATPQDATVVDVPAVDAPVDAAATLVDVVRVTPACARDPRVQPYAVGLHGIGSRYRLAVTAIDPGPDVQANYQWVVVVTDASGTPVDGLSLRAVPWMPDHHHGASVIPSISGLGSGRYAVANLDLFMAGVWTVTFTVGGDAGTLDTLVVGVCIADA